MSYTILSRRAVVEFAVELHDAPLLRAACHGDMFDPSHATLSFELHADGSLADLTNPVLVVGRSTEATTAGPASRSTSFARLGLPPWLEAVVDGVRRVEQSQRV